MVFSKYKAAQKYPSIWNLGSLHFLFLKQRTPWATKCPGLALHYFGASLCYGVSVCVCENRYVYIHIHV